MWRSTGRAVRTVAARIVPAQALTGPAPTSPATGLPTVTGTAQVGQTLTASTSGIADEDGLDDATFTYQWIRNDGAQDVDIQDATSSTYTLVDADQGKTLKVRVSFTDDRGHGETLASAATGEVEARPNSPAMGLPTITGTAQIGEMLTADTAGISDADGLNDASFSYQWTAGGTDIPAATSATYTLVASDQGQTIKVRVRFTDDKGNEESLTSAATVEVAARANSLSTGAPTITGTAQVGETLSVSTSDIADADGLTSVSYSYRWIRSDSSTDTDISGATASTYSPSIADQGKTVKVRVSFTDDAGNTETLTSAATAEVAGAPAEPNSPATGQPTISGTAQVSETLTASTSGIADADGLDNASFDYQWLTDDADIHGATGSTYALDADDEGKTLKVRVSFTDDAGNEETLTSEPTAAVAAEPNSPATGQPTITGTAQVGETLTVGTAGISDANGMDNVTFAYQWITGGSDIAGATGSTYTLTATEQGQTIQVRVSFTDDDGNQEALTSAATAAVAAKPNSPARGLPTIGGTLQVGETLTASTSGIADEDGLDNASFSYQWVRNDGSTDADIQGRHRLHLYAGRRRPRQDRQGAGVIHRRRGEHGDLDQRGHRRGGRGTRRAQQPGHRPAHHQWNHPGGRNADGLNVGDRRR